ncbi:MAG: helix-turn-helix transcriptional regulator [Treponemataceae bacterium]|nr:helix-turn-helix transcriptional regulator [Treponemataceae bacterium]
MDLRTVFITNLKRFRKEQKMSQMHLAELCETSTSYIGEIEIAKKFPSIEMIEKIARALNVRPFQLFQDEPNSTIASDGDRKKKRALVEKIQKSVEDIIMGEKI